MPARSFGASAGHTQEALAAMGTRAWLCAEKPFMGSFRELFSAEPTWSEDVPGFHALSLGAGTCEGSGLAVPWLDSHRTGSLFCPVRAAPLWVRPESGASEGGLGPGTGPRQELKRTRLSQRSFPGVPSSPAAPAWSPGPVFPF